MYSIVVAEMYQPCHIFSFIRRQTAIEFFCDTWGKMILHYLVQLCQTAEIFQFLGAFIQLGVREITVNLISIRGITYEIFVYGEHALTCSHKHGMTLVVAQTAIALHHQALKKAHKQYACQQ